MLRLVVRSAVGHARRLALAGLAVVIGVAFVAGALTLADSARRSYGTLVHQVTTGTDVYVRGPETDVRQGIGDFTPLPEAVISLTARVPGVGANQGQIVRLGSLVDPRGVFMSPTTTTYVLSWPKVATLASFSLVTGRAPVATGEVAVDASTAARNRLAVGSPLRVGIGVASPQPARVVGIVRPRVGGDLTNASSVFVDQAWAQSVLHIPGRVDLIELAATPGVSPDDLRARVAAVLPNDGTQAITSRQYADAQLANLTRRAGSATIVLVALAGLALLVGGGVVFNSFGLLVHERVREVALLRAVGMSRRQVFVSVLGEWLSVGVVASVSGAALGGPAAAALRRVGSWSGRSVATGPIAVRLDVLAVAACSGVVLVAVAGLLPARRATLLSPVEAARPDEDRRSRLGPPAAAVAVAGGACLVAARAASPTWTERLDTAGGIALALAVLVSLPAAGPIALDLVARAFRPSGSTGEVAWANLRRTPRRYIAPAASLMLGVAMVTGVEVIAGSAHASVQSLVARAERADYVIVSDAAPGVDPEAVEKVREAPAVTVVSEVGSDRFTADGRAAQFTAIDADSAPAVLNLSTHSGNITGFSDGQILLTRSEAALHGYRVGRYVAARFGTQRRFLLIAAVIADNGITQGYVIPFETYRRQYPAATIRAVFVKGAPPGELAREVAVGVRGFPGVQVLDAATYATLQARRAEAPVALVEALAGFAIVIALLGVADALALAVVARLPELSLLRVLGMTPRQLAATVAWEALAVGVVGALFGVAAGMAIGLGVVGAAGARGLTEMVVPVARVAIVVLAVVAGAVIAAVLPARRAGRVTGLEQLAP